MNVNKLISKPPLVSTLIVVENKRYFIYCNLSSVKIYIL